MASGQIPIGFGADVNGNVTDESKVAVIFMNGPGGGGIGTVYNYFYCDLGTAKLRVAFRGPTGWRVEQVTVTSEAGVSPAHPQQGESHASVCRMPLSAGEQASAGIPVGYGTNVFAA